MKVINNEQLVMSNEGRKYFAHCYLLGVVMAKRRTPEERYKESIRKQQNILEEFAAREIGWADDLLFWYRVRKEEMPDDEYRAVAFFKNREYLRKPGSLTLLYSMYQRCMNELPKPTKEIAFDLLAYRFRVYAVTLAKGGYDGGTDWG
jgi:hypothetical protein